MADKTETEARNERADACKVFDEFDPYSPYQAAMVPAGYQVLELEALQERPNRITANFEFIDPRSLAHYVNLFYDPTTMISAHYEDRTISVVLDGDLPDVPSHRSHKARYEAQFHPILKAWLEICDRPMAQRAFGRFLEDHAPNVIRPDAADVMEMVMNFDAVKRVTFKSSQRLHDGLRQFAYVEENEARGSLTLPDRFVIQTPVFEGMDPQGVTFMVRYDIEDGALRFKVEMHQKDLVLNDAFARCVDVFRLDLTNDTFIYRVG